MMHNYILAIVLNYSIVITAIAVIMKFKTMLNSYWPFMGIIFLGLINETISLVSIYSAGTNAVNGNIYVLLEFMLIIYQFFKWDSISKRTFFILAITGIIIWVTDNFILSSISQNNSLFRTIYSLIIVFLSINKLNMLIIYENGYLLKNATFIICITFLVYYGCKAFVEAFNALHLGLNHNILGELWIIMYFVNAVANILYAIAILCIPRKQKFILRY